MRATKSADSGMEDASIYVDRVASIAQIFANLARTVRNTLVSNPTAPGSGQPGDLRTLDCLLAVLEAPPPAGCRSTALHTFYALQSLADDAARVSSLSLLPKVLFIYEVLNNALSLFTLSIIHGLPHHPAAKNPPHLRLEIWFQTAPPVPSQLSSFPTSLALLLP